MKSIYLDNCATTQPYPEVVDTIVSMLKDNFGNPSSLHSEGQRAKEILDNARQTVADAIGACPQEVFFTSGGTESDNTAILGACDLYDVAPGHIVTTSVEHPAVYKPIRHLRRKGWLIDYIPIKNGSLDIHKAHELITPETHLTSIMLVNNETGTILPVRMIKQIIEENVPSSLLHCDAIQALGKVNFTADSLGADLISISGHKIHGPKGIGALYVREGTKIHRRVFGGDQERGMRSGTEAMPLIAGFAEAVRITMARFDYNTCRMNVLKQYTTQRLSQIFPDVLINTPPESAPHIVSFSLPGLNNIEAASYLSDNGICVSTSAACKSNHMRGPSMMMSFGLSSEMADSTIRIGLCSDNTEVELETMIQFLKRYRSQ